MRAALTAAALLATACNGADGERMLVEVTVEYPRQSARDQTASVHFWLLEPAQSDVLDGGCGWLVAGVTDPYDLAYRRLADFVVSEPGATAGTSGEVRRGYAMVYAETVDYLGRLQLSGCTTVHPSGSAAHAEILLVNAGSYDCADRAVKDGFPCDDGLYCTVEERCISGNCRGGTTRDCAHLDQGCWVGECDEERECHQEPASMWIYCEDGEFCTVGDTCDGMGNCVSGGARDCSYADAECRRGTCDEDINMCVSLIDNTMLCQDGYYCTENDACAGGGCSGTQVDCSIADNDCNSGVCSEALFGGCAQIPVLGEPSCDSNCTIGGTCNAGVCEGGTPTGASETEGPAGDATCADFIDNDCDTLLDEDDPDCAPV